MVGMEMTLHISIEMGNLMAHPKATTTYSSPEHRLPYAPPPPAARGRRSVGTAYPLCGRTVGPIESADLPPPHPGEVTFVWKMRERERERERGREGEREGERGRERK